MKEKFNLKGRYQDIALLQFILLLYSVGGILSKKASEQQFLSISFIALYIGVLFILMVYAVLWQQILKRMPLVTAFSSKAVVVLWGMLWGALFFGETIRLNMVIGAVIIFCGILLVVNADEK